MLDSKKELTPVVYGEYPAKVLRFYRRPNVIAMHAHWHDRMEFHRIVSGSMTLYCDDEPISLSEGDISVISPRLLHSAIAGEQGVVYDVIMFDLSSLLNGTTAIALLKPLVDDKIIFNKKCNNAVVCAAANEIINSHNCRENSTALEELGQIYSLLGLLFKYCGTRERTVRMGDERFGNVVSYINENFCDEISAFSLSQKFGYDEAYFCRKFKRNTGLTVMKYIQIMRMEKARKMLADNSVSIGRIALDCGFSDIAYFTNCFKKLYSITPTVYRKSHIKKENNDMLSM